MASKFGGFSSRRLPDKVTEELAVVLSSKASFEFKPLFTLVHANLLAKKSASGGEEMLRLRTYEKLQSLVGRGMVKKTITKTVKQYRGLASLASVLPVVPAIVPL
jgi:hypothetical protein